MKGLETERHHGKEELQARVTGIKDHEAVWTCAVQAAGSGIGAVVSIKVDYCTHSLRL